MFTTLMRFIKNATGSIQKIFPFHRYHAMDFILGAALLPGFLIDPFYGMGAVVIITGSNHFLEVLRKYKVKEPSGFKKKQLQLERDALTAKQNFIYFSLVIFSFALGYFNEGNIDLGRFLISALGMTENANLAKNMMLSFVPLMGITGIFFGSKLRKNFFPGLYKHIGDPKFSSIVAEHARLISDLEQEQKLAFDIFENVEDEFGLMPLPKAVCYDQLIASCALIKRGASVQGPILLLYLQKIAEMVPPAENDQAPDNNKNKFRYPRQIHNRK